MFERIIKGIALLLGACLLAASLFLVWDQPVRGGGYRFVDYGRPLSDQEASTKVIAFCAPGTKGAPVRGYQLRSALYSVGPTIVLLLLLAVVACASTAARALVFPLIVSLSAVYGIVMLFRLFYSLHSPKQGCWLAVATMLCCIVLPFVTIAQGVKTNITTEST